MRRLMRDAVGNQRALRSATVAWQGLLLALATTLPATVRTRADEPADPRRPAAIATQDVPAVPPEVFAQLRQYQNIRQAEFAGWSPDGRGMLVRTRFGNAAQLHRVYEPGGRREQWTFFDEPVEGRFVPADKHGSLLVTASEGGNENFQVYRLDRQQFATALLTDGKSRNELGPVREDGTQMIVHSNRRNGRDTDIYVCDTRRPEVAEMLLQTDGQFWVASDWSADGKWVLVSRQVSINEAYPALIEVATKSLKPLPLPAEGQAAVGSMAFSRDGRAAYFTTDAQGEFLQLVRLDLATLKFETLSGDIPWDVDGLEVDARTGRVAFTVNENGASRLYLLAGGARRTLELPLGIVHNLEFSPDGEQLGFTLARPDVPSDAYALDLADGQLTRWTFSEAGGLNPARFVRPRLVEFASFDGRKIPAYYFRPEGASEQRPAAALVMIHGGPESQYRPEFSAMIQYYVAELGLAVILPNVRGSAGYGKSYLLLDNGPRREDSVRDIGALLDWIGGQPELDARRVAVTGGSYGGYMVLASLVHFGERIRAGIDIVGIANFITFLEHTSPYRQDLRRVEYGDERDAAMRATFEKINPSARAGEIRSALLVVHGRNDPRVPFSEAEQIVAKVRAQGRTVWTVYANNEGHGFAKKDNRDYQSAVETVFLRQHLLGE